MTREEEITKIIMLFANQEIILRKEIDDSAARIIQVARSPAAGYIRVKLILDRTRYWNIDVSINNRTVNWLGPVSITTNWDLIMDGLSFKKCIRDGVGVITLYDLI